MLNKVLKNEKNFNKDCNGFDLMYSVSGSVMKGNQKAKLSPSFDWLQIIFFGLIMLT